MPAAGSARLEHVPPELKSKDSQDVLDGSFDRN